MSDKNTIGVVVGNTNTDSYSFILTSMAGSKGDLSLYRSRYTSIRVK